MKIGSHDIKNPIALAPMEDVTDLPFRIISKRRGADIVYTEFTSSEALIRDIPKALRKIEICDEERPVGIQIFGGVESSIAGAARVAESFKPDLIDINCGCWVKNHALRGEGAGLLRDLSQFERIVRATVNATRLPVTVKTRLGWDEKSIVILDVARMVEQAGAQALTLHCRTRVQGYKGRADWTWLEKIKNVISIPLIANGDITTPQDIKQIFENGCDGVMIGRGALTNPWIFQQAKHFLKTGQALPPPTLLERIEQCILHLKLSVDHKGMRHGVLTFRKYYAGYFSGVPNFVRLRNDVMQMAELDPVIKRLYQFLDESSQMTVPTLP